MERSSFVKIEKRINHAAEDYRWTETLKAYSHLMYEYLRRLSFWCSRDEYKSAWSLGDLTTHIAANDDFEDAKIESIIKRISTYHEVSLPQAQVYTNMLRFYWHLPHFVDVMGKYSLQDPYEPVLAFLERGGHFTMHHGEVLISVASIRVGRPEDWMTRKPVPSLDHSFLDELNTLDEERRR